jgi:hypothetical protein
MKIIKEKSVVVITDDDDKYLNAFPAASESVQARTRKGKMKVILSTKKALIIHSI